jgi:hypothetical protein
MLYYRLTGLQYVEDFLRPNDEYDCMFDPSYMFIGNTQLLPE